MSRSRSNNGSKSKGGGSSSSSKHRSGSNNSPYYYNETLRDPALLLARGFTARYLAVNNSTISGLTNEEIDRDLRHITAYAEAATRYHQLTYATTNRITVEESLQTSSSTYLPVTIDPEEEKRIEIQKKRIQRAEAVREELEQHYVSLRAHYVMTTQDVTQLQTNSVKALEFLQSNVQTASTTLALLRTRLQMAREILSTLKLRTAILAEAGLQQVNDPTQYVPETNCPIQAVWSTVEEQLKKSTTNNKNRKGGNVLPWNCTSDPATPFDVPQLVSCMSTVPEKSIAWKSNSMFGSNGLMWLENHLPDEIIDNDDDNNKIASSEDNIESLREQVSVLEKELIDEREQNQVLLTATGKARARNDEWVAMIALVRQETEAVLHRHNILLDSDKVREAAAAAAVASIGHTDDIINDNNKDHHHEDHNNNLDHNTNYHEEEDDDDDHEEGEIESGVVVRPTEITTTTTTAHHHQEHEDQENEADDEGMIDGGGEDDDNWETSAGGKRGVAATDDNTSSSPSNRNKRRKL